MNGVNHFNPLFLAGGVLIGALLAVPVSFFVAKRIGTLMKPASSPAH
jgi:peptidoglycan biosynthesis protein MviN/MurJ (putative lipid II flippase)